MTHMPTDSLSYTNKLQSPQKLLLMISIEGLMVAGMAGICCFRNELNEFNFFSWKKVISKEVSDRVSLWFSLILQTFTFIAVTSWACKYEETWQPLKWKILRSRHTKQTGKGLTYKWQYTGTKMEKGQEQIEIMLWWVDSLLGFALTVHWRTLLKVIQQSETGFA